MVPRPANLAVHAGSFSIFPIPRIRLEPDEPPVRAAAGALKALLERAGTGQPGAPGSGEIRLVLSLPASGAATSPEAYSITIAPTLTTVTAASAAAFPRALATLAQLTQGSPTAWPCLALADAPRYPHRGLLLDVARHFRSAEYLRRTLDRMALLKLNVLHLHLTDDQGWRLPVRAYPDLVRIGSRRRAGPPSRDGAYSEAELAELIAHAAALGIRVVPEIDMPGHATAAIAARPELSCTGGELPVPETFGTHDTVLCVGRESTFAFVSDVLADVCRRFPDPLVHLGGDEVPRRRWEECPRCRARVTAVNLRSTDELQAYFLSRAAGDLARAGKRPVVWDDDRGHGFPAGTVVQTWHGEEATRAVLTAGHETIASPADWTYLDRSPLHLPLAQVLEFDPRPKAIGEKPAARLLGGEAALWSERVVTDADADRRLYPRLAAFAEALWSGPTADERGFLARVKAFDELLVADGGTPGDGAHRAGFLSPRQLSGSWNWIRLDVTPFVDEPGAYRVALGEGAPAPVQVRAVRLLRDGIPVAQVTRDTTSTADLPERIYDVAFTTAPVGRQWFLEIEARAPRPGAAMASVWIERPPPVPRHRPLSLAPFAPFAPSVTSPASAHPASVSSPAAPAR